MDTLGLVEVRGIATGAALADRMVKVAQVDLLRAGTVCSGRYLIHVGGDREAVATAVRAAEHAALETERPLAASYVLANISDQVLDVLRRSVPAVPGDAVSVVECRTVAAGIAAADAAAKRAEVRLLRLVAGQGINGKSYFVMGGEVAAVEDAADAARAAAGSHLLDLIVIPRPDAAVVAALTHTAR